MEQRRHPGESGGGEIRSGDHGERAGNFHGVFDLDAVEARVGEGAAHYVAVDHPGKMHVVDVGAFALNESGIFFAFDGVAHATDFGRGRLDHAVAPFCMFLAAYWIALTMF